MVLINCSKDCLHQKEGLCTLDISTNVTGESVDGCCYYSSAGSEKTTDSKAQQAGEHR